MCRRNYKPKLSEAGYEIRLFCMMLNHVTIITRFFPKVFLHSQVANEMALSFRGELSLLGITPDVAVTLIGDNCQSFDSLKCDCKGHQFVEQYHLDVSNGVEISEERTNLVDLLSDLCTFDSREHLKVQSEGQFVSTLINYIIKKQKIKFIDCSLKGVFLKVSFAVYSDTDTRELKELNVRPDFYFCSSHRLGIVKSSPFLKMVTVGLGHISSPLTRYLLGICVANNRSVFLYLISNEQNMEVVTQEHSDEMYVGEVDDKLTSLLENLVSVIDFIRKDYLERYAALTHEKIPEDTTVALLKSLRKRSSSNLDN